MGQNLAETMRIFMKTIAQDLSFLSHAMKIL